MIRTVQNGLLDHFSKHQHTHLAAPVLTRTVLLYMHPPNSYHHLYTLHTTTQKQAYRSKPELYLPKRMSSRKHYLL
jgi:hypothetical protein